ncbi:MFS transporter [Photobacterium sanguinicancri]|uniref:MFS transporter n=1 Tax=Photobacterium sanguinicancri TaxID=875932 RepID=A0AAW7Y1K1_9GAMM|nr:MFS transporter [Photobacterium sanguinicancri]MDO6541616.1 MFS transporter [Photobacterium sanguinicancri]
MSLFSMPFVDSGVDTALHVIASVVMVGTIAAAAFGFWRLHELPIQKAHSKDHHQLGLITALTWIGFVWHWVWVIAVVIAFVDGEQALRRIRDIWKGDAPSQQPAASMEKVEAVISTPKQETEHA